MNLSDPPMMSRLLLTVVFAAYVLTQEATASPLVYSVRDLGGLPGGTDGAVPTDINDMGQVVGASYTLGGYRAFLWQDGTINEIAADARYASISAGTINNTGEIVGTRYTPEGRTSAFLWQNGVTLDLGALPNGENNTRAGKINNHGIVTGISGERPFIWESGVMRDFTTFAEAGDFRSAIINNNGTIAGMKLGQSVDGDVFRHAVLWKNGRTIDLGDLPGGTFNLVVNGNDSRASAINDAEQVAGRSDGANGYNAFLWSNGIMTDLGALPGLGRNISGPNDINNNGVVVGWSGDDATRAFVWDQMNGMHDLNTLLDDSGADWLLTTANAINNSGQIVGAGYLDGHLRGYLLTPVPEPSTWLSALIGAATAAFIAAIKLFRNGGKVLR